MEPFALGLGLLLAIVTVVVALVYFARVTLPRPPGVFGLGDVLGMLVTIILIPYVYLALPTWAMTGTLIAGGASLVALTLEPLLTAKLPGWLAAFALAGLDVWLARRYGTLSVPFLLLNNTLLIVGVVGAANVWAQAGLSARNLAVLGGLLAVYDVVFTSLLPLMADLMAHVAELPLGPLVRWPLATPGWWVGVGLGDLVLTAVAPLVFWKAYGRAAMTVAAAVSVATVAVAMVLIVSQHWTRPLPLMAIFGPLTVLEYMWWRSRYATERTTRTFRTIPAKQPATTDSVELEITVDPLCFRQ